MNLFFLPHAGSSAMGYMSFRNVINEDINMYPLEIAGRGKRVKEKCFDDIRLCAKDLFEKNRELFNKEPYAIFAHSMGTVLAYELVKSIEKNGYQKPMHIFFSGRVAPFCNVDIGVDKNNKNDDDIMDFLKICGGLPEVVINNKELMKMTFPILKNDILMTDEYVEKKGSYKLDFDISVLYGKDDILVRNNMKEWQECTIKKCQFYKFDGGHFYYKDNKKDVANIINNTLLAFNQEEKKL